MHDDRQRTPIKALHHRWSLMRIVDCFSKSVLTHESPMKSPKFILRSDQELQLFTLRKEGENWEEQFDSIHRAMLFARLLPDSKGLSFVIYSSRGMELAHMTV
jgi:hypothetical protein